MQLFLPVSRRKRLHCPVRAARRSGCLDIVDKGMDVRLQVV